MKRVALMSSAVYAVFVLPAFADDLTISSSSSVAVQTSSAANGTAGNITIAPGGSVALTATGTAVTLDSSNTVTNNGTISNSGASGAVGVNIVAGNTGSFINAGNITIPGTGSPPTSTGQFGILLDGTGVFTGNIVTATGSSVTVGGYGAAGISIKSELAGNISNSGTIKSSGTTSTGIITTAAIDGAFANYGNITTDSGNTGTTTSHVPAGSAVAIGSSVGGGILNAGPINGGNTTAAVIGTIGTGPALLISPSVGGNASLTIGVVSDATNPGFSLLNRGNISASGEQPAINATALQLSESSSTYTTTLTGGIFNSGTISATATSDNAKATSVASVPTNATGISIESQATVPNLVNDSHGVISAVTGGPSGGIATALVIGSGGSLTSLTNAGSLTASSTASNASGSSVAAYAIDDLGGHLTTIDNSGTISATGTIAGVTQNMVAANLAATTSAITFTNTGTVDGDIIFGNSTGNVLTVEGAHASVSGMVKTTGLGLVDISVSSGGTGGTLETSYIHNAHTLTVGANGSIVLDVGNITTVVNATGPVTFDASSHITVKAVSLPPTSVSINLIHSSTSLTFADQAATTANIDIPFLFTGNLSSDSRNLTLNLQRKTATQLGLTGNAAIIYEPAAEAAALDTEFGSALTALGSTAEVQSVMQQLGPQVSAVPRDMAIALTDYASGPVGARQRTLMMTQTTAGEGGVWGQGLHDIFSGSGANGYNANGTGGAVGVDWSRTGTGHFGVAFTIYNGSARDKSQPDSKIDTSWDLFSLYMGFESNNFFFNAQTMGGYGSLQGDRTVTVGSLTRTAKTRGWSQLAAGQDFTGGYLQDFGILKVAPQIGLDGLYLQDSRYQDSGAGPGVDLTVEGRSESSVRAFAGVSVGGTYTVEGVDVVPQFLGGWSHELLAKPGAIHAAFSATSSSFIIPGPQTDASRFVFGGNVDVILTRWTVGLNYHASSASKTLEQTASLTLGARF